MGMSSVQGGGDTSGKTIHQGTKALQINTFIIGNYKSGIIWLSGVSKVEEKQQRKKKLYTK